MFNLSSTRNSSFLLRREADDELDLGEQEQEQDLQLSDPTDTNTNNGEMNEIQGQQVEGEEVEMEDGNQPMESTTTTTSSEERKKKSGNQRTRVKSLVLGPPQGGNGNGNGSRIGNGHGRGKKIEGDQKGNDEEFDETQRKSIVVSSDGDGIDQDDQREGEVEGLISHHNQIGTGGNPSSSLPPHQQPREIKKENSSPLTTTTTSSNSNSNSNSNPPSKNPSISSLSPTSNYDSLGNLNLGSLDSNTALGGIGLSHSNSISGNTSFGTEVSRGEEVQGRGVQSKRKREDGEEEEGIREMVIEDDDEEGREEEERERERKGRIIEEASMDEDDIESIDGEAMTSDPPVVQSSKTWSANEVTFKPKGSNQNPTSKSSGNTYNQGVLKR